MKNTLIGLVSDRKEKPARRNNEDITITGIKLGKEWYLTTGIIMAKEGDNVKLDYTVKDGKNMIDVVSILDGSPEEEFIKSAKQKANFTDEEIEQNEKDCRRTIKKDLTPQQIDIRASHALNVASTLLSGAGTSVDFDQLEEIAIKILDLTDRVRDHIRG